MTVLNYIISIAIYVYFAYSLMIIAQKTGTENSWMAWIPFLNLYLMTKVARKTEWFLYLLLAVVGSTVAAVLAPFLPTILLVLLFAVAFLLMIVGVVLYVMVWMRIAEVRGFPTWWGILAIVPIVNIIVPGYLAFAEPPHVGHPAAHR